MIGGYRGRKPVDLIQLEKIIVSLQTLSSIPGDRGNGYQPDLGLGGLLALDARIILDPTCLEYYPPYPHLAITPYPTRYITPYNLSDGTVVLLRPIRPEDEPLEYDMLTTLSPGGG